MPARSGLVPPLCPRHPLWCMGDWCWRCHGQGQLWGWLWPGNLCALEQGSGRAGGCLPAPAPHLISLQRGQWHQPAQQCRRPPRPLPWSCWCPLQGQGVLASLAASLPAPCLQAAAASWGGGGRGDTARPAPSGCWGAGFGLSHFRKWCHFPEWLGCHCMLSQ